MAFTTKNVELFGPNPLMRCLSIGLSFLKYVNDMIQTRNKLKRGFFVGDFTPKYRTGSYFEIDHPERKVLYSLSLYGEANRKTLHIVEEYKKAVADFDNMRLQASNFFEAPPSPNVVNSLSALQCHVCQKILRPAGF
ncbi:hypothetical protein AVEN_267710-1 [Araneus ventricosus]|uniref:Uncharacterized protein n=1 Tax=Araneus ventricosus TaxID=182803 RepID=A0A4Y2CX67_ARAVE|nr:hypothetical protein AVEN_267710-1 [Araneus ventricosus]